MNILEKLAEKLNKGIDTEAEASYLLVEIRKFLEQQRLNGDFEYLKFHCDWIAHPILSGRMAQKVLTQFDEANIHLKAGIEMEQLPHRLRREIERLSNSGTSRRSFQNSSQITNFPQ